MIRTLLAFAALGSAGGESMIGEALEQEFEQFVAKFGKFYASEPERASRFAQFAATQARVEVLNSALEAQGLEAVHGVTEFADWSDAEFASMAHGTLPTMVQAPVAVPKAIKAPTFLDWRDKGVVTAVKNQGRCGSCWAHAAVETIESARALAGFDLEELSVQQLVSCDSEDKGCDGGWYFTAWDDYVETTGGLASAADYPYDMKTMHLPRASPGCVESLAADVVPGTAVSSFAWAAPPCLAGACAHQNEDLLKRNLASYGPIAIACDAEPWKTYVGGVVTNATCTKSSARKLDHAIQLVGYNEDAETPYWIVRNSWADTWGEDGYIYLKMGENTCGIADKPAFVYLDDAVAVA